MGRIHAEIAGRDIRIEIPELLQGNNPTDAVMSAGVKEMEMEREIDRIPVIMEAKR